LLWNSVRKLSLLILLPLSDALWADIWVSNTKCVPILIRPKVQRQTTAVVSGAVVISPLLLSTVVNNNCCKQNAMLGTCTVFIFITIVLITPKLNKRRAKFLFALRYSCYAPACSGDIMPSPCSSQYLSRCLSCANIDSPRASRVPYATVGKIIETTISGRANLRSAECHDMRVPSTRTQLG